MGWMARILWGILLLAGYGVINAHATNIQVINAGQGAMCAKYWVPVVGGACSELQSGQVWNVAANPSWAGATMWAVSGSCVGQPCNGGPPSGVTQFEFTINGSGGNDFYDLSTNGGFNMGIHVSPSNAACPSLDCSSLGASCQSSIIHTCPYASTDYVLSFFP